MKFEMEPNVNGGYKVALNGVDRSSEIAGVEVAVGLDHIPHVTLAIPAATAGLTLVDARVAVDDLSKDLLLQLGWTPPEGQQLGEDAA